ncbi:MAG: phosphoglycerate kinase [Rickettsiaceae bacterium H1]|nr:phosphoglycerate kinase [Rickettsiaceae bacterium H1]
MKVVTQLKDLDKKTVIVRVDFNVPVNGGKIEDDTRIKNSIPTIRHLLAKKCKVILISHLGRPKGHDLNLSLTVLIDELRKLVNAKVIFARNTSEVKPKLAEIIHGEILLMENIRFYSEEENNDLGFAKKLASFGQVYINDAFSCSHRNHASIATLPSLLPSAAGLSLVREVNALNSIFDQSCRPVVAIIGGAKISTKIELIHSLAVKFDYMVIAGALANNVLNARGINVGLSLIEEEIKEDFDQYDNIILPQDVLTASDVEGEVHVCDVRNIPKKEKVFDVGPATVMQIKNILNQCKTVVWNGPMGLFEMEHFSKGTKNVAEAIAKLSKEGKIKSIVGGGNSRHSLNKFNIDSNLFTHASDAGGAFLEWMIRQTLSNLDRLK